MVAEGAVGASLSALLPQPGTCGGSRDLALSGLVQARASIKPQAALKGWGLAGGLLWSLTVSENECPPRETAGGGQC